MKFQLEPFHRDTPDSELLEDLRNVNRILIEKDKKLTSRSYNEVGKYTSGTLALRFGSWNQALVKLTFRTPLAVKGVFFRPGDLEVIRPAVAG